MSMSDCIKCLETPCCCGHEWSQRDLSYLLEHQKMIKKVIKEKKKAKKLLEDAEELKSDDSLSDWLRVLQ